MTVQLERNEEWQESISKTPRAGRGDCYTATFEGIEYHALVSRDQISRQHKALADFRWHISISGDDDVPPWDAMVAIAHKIRPGVPFVIGVPPESWWLNIHPHVLHLWEVKDEALLTQWKGESMGHAPS